MDRTALNDRRETARRGPWFAAGARDVDPATVQFPPDFLLGTATSAHQVEGGTTANNWSRWELTGRPDGKAAILTGERCGRAANGWRMLVGRLGDLVDHWVTVNEPVT